MNIHRAEKRSAAWLLAAVLAVSGIFSPGIGRDKVPAADRYLARISEPENGTVRFTDTEKKEREAAAGEEVSLMVVPASGFAAERVSITGPGTSGDIFPEKGEEEIVFRMPDEDVVITARFSMDPEAEEAASREAEEAASREAEEAASREAEEASSREAEEAASREAEEASSREAEEAASREAEEALSREAEEASSREAEEAASREAEEASSHEAEEASSREAEEASSREAEEAESRKAEEAASREAEEAFSREAEEASSREAEEPAGRETEDAAVPEAETAEERTGYTAPETVNQDPKPSNTDPGDAEQAEILFSDPEKTENENSPGTPDRSSAEGKRKTHPGKEKATEIFTEELVEMSELLAAAVEDTITDMTHESVQVNESGIDGWTPRMTGTFYYNGSPVSADVICVDPGMEIMAPWEGLPVTSVKKLSASGILAKILFYGGDRDLAGEDSFWNSAVVPRAFRNASDDLKWVVAHTAASYAAGSGRWDEDIDIGTGVTTGADLAMTLYDYADSMPSVPSTQIYFGNKKKSASLKASVVTEDGRKIQKTGTVKFSAGGHNSITLSVPDKVTIHVTGSDGETVSSTGKKITLYDGDTFYFTAAVTYTGAAWETTAAGKYAYNCDFYLLSFSSDYGGTVQDCCALAYSYEPDSLSLTVEWADEPVFVSVLKSVAGGYENLTAGNPNYSLAGTEYQVYEGKNRTGLLGSVVVQEDGSGSRLELDASCRGETVYLVETKAGRGYQLDTREYSLKLSEDENVLEVSDIPLFLPLEIEKRDASSDDGRPDASFDMSRIRFVVSYSGGGSAGRTWTVETRKNEADHFTAALDEAHLVPGSDPLYILDGEGVIPIGTLSVEEIEKEGGDYSLDNMYFRLESADGMEIQGSRADLEIVEKTRNNGTKYLVLRASGTETETSGIVLYAWDYPKFGNLQIEKISAGTRERLAGARFRLLDADGQTVVPTEENGIAGDIGPEGTITVREDGFAEVRHIPKPSPQYTYTLIEIEAPNGYKVNPAATTISINAGRTVKAVCEDEEVLIGVRIRKIDKDTGKPSPSGDSRFAGASFEIQARSPVNIRGIRYEAGDVIVQNLNLTEDGTAQTAEDALTEGDYLLHETAAPEGYGRTEDIPFTLTEEDDGKMVDIRVEDPEIRGGLEIRKTFTETGTAFNGDAKLTGIRFAIVNRSAAAVQVGNTEYAPGRITEVLVLDEEGHAETADDALPYGTYEIIELRMDATVRAGEVYDTSANLGSSALANAFGTRFAANRTSVEIRADKKKAAAVFRNDTSPVDTALKKTDADNTTMQGDADFEGIRFAVINRSTAAAEVSGTLYAPGSVIAILTTDENGDQAVSLGPLPYGEYEMTELRADAGIEAGDLFDEVISDRGGSSEYANRHGYLYVPNSARQIMHEDGKVYEFSFTDPVVRGGIDLYKTDAGTGRRSPQGDASLKGAEFTIRNAGRNPVRVNGDLIPAGEAVMVLTTNEEGIASTGKNILPYGTYQITETRASEAGYLLFAGTKTVEIRENGATITETIEEPVIHGGFILGKEDRERKANIPQGDATLAGAEFTVYNAGRQSVLVDGTEYGPDEEIMKILTGEDGKAETGTVLPYGTYRIAETKAPEGYLNSGYDRTLPFHFDTDGQIIDISGESAVSEQVIRGGVQIRKTDRQSGQSHAQGSASLAGAAFTIYNRSRDAVLADADGDGEPEKLVQPGEEVFRIITDEEGIARTNDRDLPYGSYEIVEEKGGQPEGYLGPDEYPDSIYSRSFEIRRDGEMVDFTGADGSIADQVIRGDLTLRKINSASQQKMAFIPFRLTSRTTGEWHIIMTDANGQYSSRKVKHSVNTNGGDQTNGDVSAGLWFGLDENGSPLPPDDSLGALPYDTYIIEELPCEGNEGMQLWSDEFEVFEDCLYQGGAVIDLNNIENVREPGIGTKAGGADGTHEIMAEDAAYIVDTVSWSRLEEGKIYTLKAALMDRDSKEAVKDPEGNPVEAVKTFTCYTTYGSTEVELFFNAEGMEGLRTVVFEELFPGAEVPSEEEDGGETAVKPVAVHKEWDDEGQAIYFPEIRTAAVNPETEENIACADEEVTITDNVTFRNLTVGKKYTVQGVLMDHETGRELKDADGKIITAAVSFTARDRDGRVKVVFNFNGSHLGGKKAVVFEELYRGNVLLASHADIHDEAQTVYLEKPSEPETSAPETTAPEPETSAPETTVPEPETSAPETTTAVPETSAPETTTAEPETSAPETTASELETLPPETTEPETTASEPETTEPETSAHETTAPETSTPETTVPQPETTAPGPSTQTPEKPGSPAEESGSKRPAPHSNPKTGDETVLWPYTLLLLAAGAALAFLLRRRNKL